MAGKNAYVGRLAEAWISELLRELPALMLVGPRAAGKTTTAMRHARTVLRLDERAVRDAVAANPDAVLRDAEAPVLVDEWQLESAVLGAAKRIVDVDDEPGRFLFTGSATDDLNVDAWPGTGRFIRVPFWGLTRREIEGASLEGTFFDCVARPSFNGAFELPKVRPDTIGYIERALASGFPQAIKLSSDRTRTAWLNSYVDHLVSRDLALIAEVRDPTRMRRYLGVLASSTAGTPSMNTLLEAASLNRETALRYDMLLERLFVTEQIPAWSNNRLTRLSAHSKRYFCDPGLVATLLGTDRRTLLRDADLLGRIMDTFVVAQLRPELALGTHPVQMFHLRQDGRREVDLVLERSDGAVLAIEVKAASSVTKRDARHLVWLRDSLMPKTFRAGIVFYTGPLITQLEERIWAVPICALWGARA
jgi:uncharacterized protein